MSLPYDELAANTTSEAQLSLDGAYLQGLSERFVKMENLVESINLVMSRIDKLSRHPQSIQIEPGLFVDRDQLLKVEGRRLTGFAIQMLERAKDLVNV